MKRKLIVFMILILIFVLAISGCVRQKISEKIAENVVEKIAENASDGDVDVDITKDGVSISGDDGKMNISGGENLSWPEDAPDAIPEFEGNIFSSIVTDNSLAVGANDVALDEFGAYVGLVELAGFESGDSIEGAGAYMKQYTMDGIKLTMTYTEEAETLSILAEWE